MLDLTRDRVASSNFDGDVAEQTRRVMNNIKAVLSAAGLSLSDVVKTTIFLASMDDFQTVNQAYAEFFDAVPTMIPVFKRRPL